MTLCISTSCALIVLRNNNTKSTILFWFLHKFGTKRSKFHKERNIPYALTSNANTTQTAAYLIRDWKTAAWDSDRDPDSVATIPSIIIQCSICPANMANRESGVHSLTMNYRRLNIFYWKTGYTHDRYRLCIYICRYWYTYRKYRPLTIWSFF